MLAKKGNKVYKVTDANRKSYQDAGYDICDETGKTVAYGRGKTVPYEEYAALKAENEALKSAQAAADTEQKITVTGTKKAGK